MENIVATQETMSEDPVENVSLDQDDDIGCSQISRDSKAAEIKNDMETQGNEKAAKRKPEINPKIDEMQHNKFCRMEFDDLSVRKSDGAAYDFRVKENREMVAKLAMKILRVRKNSTEVVLYEHSASFFRILKFFAKNLACLGITHVLADGWENLSDDIAQQEFLKWAELSQSDNLKTYSAGELFCMFCTMTGRLLELEKEKIEDSYEFE